VKKALRRLRKKAAKRKPKRPSEPVHLVVGLRNPGPDYEGTRHNLGYEIVARTIEKAGETPGRGPSRIRGLVAQVGAGDDRTLFLVPNTFMNESGGAVRAALDYYKIDPSELLVVHDDIDLPFGRLRIQVNGGSGGHNGIRSLERALGTTEFSRLKAGVGRPPGSQDPADFVLRDFTRRERPEVDLMVEDAAEVVERWLDDRARAQELAALRGRDIEGGRPPSNPPQHDIEGGRPPSNPPQHA
jgi:PTH1 family peptidyl-tRNA hydrolase